MLLPILGLRAAISVEHCLPAKAHTLQSCRSLAIICSAQASYSKGGNGLHVGSWKTPINYPCSHSLKNIFHTKLWIWIKAWRGWLKKNSLWREMNHPTIIVFYLPFHSKGPGSCQSTLRNLTTKQGHLWGCRENASRKKCSSGRREVSQGGALWPTIALKSHVSWLVPTWRPLAHWILAGPVIYNNQQDGAKASLGQLWI